MGGSELLARVKPPLAAQPFAVQQVSARQFHSNPRAPEMVDRLAVQCVGEPTVDCEGAGASFEAQRPGRAGGTSAL
jgi:hypothetical protein